ncbi:EamA family transporter [Pedobacter xixiisoli]|uniref:Inner membrane transporter RhtA n=1 Tax=Pedobacter xixiisoli TaxID=1476464 RepID=A0A285ZYU4_9SPHI|nr:DMT family transporter [Pedobacter xixiisoli]SOD14826.1 inner membrane transporter RhtA [Pedobacter xixiisoli]
MKIKNIPPIPAVLLAITSVQGGAAIAKGMFPLLGATATVTLRIGLSAIILLLAYRPNFKKITATQWKLVSLYGISLGSMNLTFYLSLSRIPLGLAVTLEFIGPLILAIAASKKATDLIWAVMAAAGIALIAPWSGESNVDMIGALLSLVAGGFWALYIIMGGKVSKAMDSGAAVSVGMLIASCVVLPFAFADGHLFDVTPKLLAMGLAIALLSSAIPFTLEMNALKHIPAKTFSILMSLEPAAAAICGLFFLHEYLSFNEWAAIALVVGASTGSTLTKAKQPTSH